MVATSFVSIREQQINIVSKNLQVVTPQETTSSLQIRSIASIAYDIAATAKLILTNFILYLFFVNNQNKLEHYKNAYKTYNAYELSRLFRRDLVL